VAVLRKWKYLLLRLISAARELRKEMQILLTELARREAGVRPAAAT
jgi:hypothetical protein